VTNKRRLARGVAANAGNAVIIKTNQVGTLSDAWETAKLARKSHYMPIMSHRSGETTSPQLAHLSVAFQCPIIKTGVVGGSRVAKINELIRIEEMLSDRSKMAVL
jgi:enolase